MRQRGVQTWDREGALGHETGFLGAKHQFTDLENGKEDSTKTKTVLTFSELSCVQLDVFIDIVV